jgi:hypothetical protein
MPWTNIVDYFASLSVTMKKQVFGPCRQIFSGVSNPKEVEDILNEQLLPEKDAELLKRRRAKKLSDECGGAGAPMRLFGDGIKFDNSYLSQASILSNSYALYH